MSKELFRSQGFQKCSGMVTRLFESNGYLNGDCPQRLALLILFSISSEARQAKISLNTFRELMGGEIGLAEEVLEQLIKNESVKILNTERNGALILQLMEVNPV